MNNDNGYTIYCSRCGAEMNSNSRYCMKCGNLNYNHAANQNMRPYIDKQAHENYQVGSGKFMIGNPSSGQILTSVANNTGNKMLCFFVNFFLFILTIIIWFILTIGEMDFNSIIGSVFPILLIVNSILFLLIYSMELIYTKCNKRWWTFFVPVYRFMVLAEITFDQKWLGLLSFVPGVGAIFCLMMLYRLGTQFKRSGIMMVLFPFIMIPVIGFGGSSYQGRTFASDSQEIEEEYKLNRMFFFTLLGSLFLGILFLIIANFSDIKKTSKLIGNFYYVYASQKIVYEVKSRIAKEGIECPINDYEKGNGSYYIYLSDAGRKAFILFNMSRDAFETYVRVDNTGEESKYYISITDGTYGFPETLIDDVNLETVIEYPELSKEYKNGIQCKFRY